MLFKFHNTKTSCTELITGKEMPKTLNIAKTLIIKESPDNTTIIVKDTPIYRFKMTLQVIDHYQ